MKDSELQTLMTQVSDGLVSYTSKGHRLTDDKAPVELLGMRVIDSLIQGEIGYYKEIFEQEGLQGLMNAM